MIYIYNYDCIIQNKHNKKLCIIVQTHEWTIASQQLYNKLYNIYCAVCMKGESY